MSENVFVAVDIGNLWSACQDLYGETYRISYPAVLGRLREKELDRELDLYAYVASIPQHKVDPDTGQVVFGPPKNKRFLEYLESIGFVIKERRVQYGKNRRPLGNDCSSWVAIDAIDKIKEYDVFTLVVGSKDYQVLINELQDRGKRVEVVTFRTEFSRLMGQQADEIIYLGDNEVFQEKPIRRSRRGEPA
jgi:hypothetical protein